MKKIVQILLLLLLLQLLLLPHPQVAWPTSSNVRVHLKNSVSTLPGNVMEERTAEMAQMKKIVQNPHQPHHLTFVTLAPNRSIVGLPGTTSSDVWTESAPSVPAAPTVRPTTAVGGTPGTRTPTSRRPVTATSSPPRRTRSARHAPTASQDRCNVPTTGADDANILKHSYFL